ncbi:hypothetical protein RC74_20255 [Falsihalocynthiibacter arcticus]|uniref:Uncharacterized protein n=1 Tax=Falsihalocynthiibacter arcticus TaxID=1579316 RepID=A0A126V5Y8_9RHOB|nr:hypothetical protein RC74_20255 [Falsihalocynthiibacter arcticus]
MSQDRLVTLCFKKGGETKVFASRSHAKLMESIFRSHLGGTSKSRWLESTLSDGSMVVDMNELSAVVNCEYTEK